MISINIAKARDIAHSARRTARSAAFAPLDVKATIPTEAAAAEAERQLIRDLYADLQTQIDEAATAEELAGLVAMIASQSTGETP